MSDADIFDGCQGHYAYCKNCGRVCVFDDWCFIHLDGWANCRSRENAAVLDDNAHCAPDFSSPIYPMPQNNDEAMRLPMKGWSRELALAKRAGMPLPATVAAALTLGVPLAILGDPAAVATPQPGSDNHTAKD